ncbi:hypothetical protein ACOJBO_07355 [Rhizobium beringeri]
MSNKEKYDAAFIETFGIGAEDLSRWPPVSEHPRVGLGWSHGAYRLS